MYIHVYNNRHITKLIKLKAKIATFIDAELHSSVIQTAHEPTVTAELFSYCSTKVAHKLSAAHDLYRTSTSGSKKN